METLSATYQIDGKLCLTEVRESDSEQLIKLLNDPLIFQNTLTIPNPYTKKDAEFYFDLCRQFEKDNGLISNFAVRQDDLLIGGIGLLFNYGINSHRSEFGYWIGKPFRQKGIARIVVDRFVELVFNKYKLTRIEANVFLENIASQKVLERCEFEREGLIKASFVKGDVLKDSYLYARLNPEHTKTKN